MVNCLGVSRRDAEKRRVRVGRYVPVKVDKRVNRMLKKNLGEVLNELGEPSWGMAERFSVGYNPNLTESTRIKLNETLKALKEFRLGLHKF